MIRFYVGRVQRKEERKAELKARFELEIIRKYEKLQGANLYLKNLDDNVNDEKLKELFSKLGTITSCKVMLESYRHIKGYTLVVFSTPEDESMRPGGYSKFHYVVPPIETGSSWAKGGYLKSWKSPTSAAKPDATSLTPTNQGFRYMGNGRNGIDLLVVPQGIRDHMMPFPFDGLGISSAPTDNQRHGGALSSTLASALAFVTQENQRLMLGEHLYPHVEQFTSNH
ncbi:Polyadenylate-binding protein 5 [Glycine max]|nr:Polyadenylate-binding protein 5 [Glycine max]